jgi:hypothetical protein
MRLKPTSFAGLVTAALVVLASPAGAQYFGQNKVQYRDFNFKVQKTEHFDIYYYPEEHETAEAVALMAERWYERLSHLFKADLEGRQPLILYASGPQFRQTNAVRGQLGEGTGGVTEGLRRRIVMPSAGGLAETNHVLGHELVHAFQYDLTSRERSGAMRLPLWAVEGIAEYLSIGPEDSQTAMWLRDSLARDDLPTLKTLGKQRFFPYRYGQAFWAYIGGRWSDETAVKLFKFMLDSGSPEDAVKKVLDIDPKQLSKDWGAAIAEKYGAFMKKEKTPSAYGPLLVGKKKRGGELNVGPALSPDGHRLVFLSERNLFSVDLYLANLETGKVQQLASTATDPHFDSLDFIESAGDWSPDGRTFVQSVIRKGEGALAFYDTGSGKRIREVDFPDLAEVHTPSYAPDGRSVVFSALQGGLEDLWTYDLDTGKKTRLTHDEYAELQPVFSPDGRRVAFATDRFSLHLDTLEFGNYRLGMFDLETGKISELPSYPKARHSNPHFSPDGRAIFFLSDVSGATNVHRLELATGHLEQITQLRTGVAGITPLSPALTVARSSGRIAYSARENGDYPIYALDDSTASASGTPDDGTALNQDAILLPPRSQARGTLVSMLENSTAGLPGRLPNPDLPSPHKYQPKLGLEFVGQPTIGVGVDRFGSFVGGGAALFFSDMLGNHNLGVAVQSLGGLQDIGGGVAWTDLTHRLDWSVGVQHVPYIYSGGFASSVEQSGNQPVLVNRQLIGRQFYTSAFAQGAWPFNRAERLEIQGAARRIGFSQEVLTDVYTLDGQFLTTDKQKISDPFKALYLGSVSAAFVHDTSLFGATSPIVGSRARFEVSPSFGSVNYTDVLVDYRKYFLPVRPVTFAVRLTHFGRYGSGAEDPRFGSIYIGYPEFIRGYNNISSDECRPTETDPCPVFDNLFGSRIAIGNAELRAPLVGLFKGRMTYGPLPVELVLFADAGVAWTQEHKASFLGGDRSLLTSAGAAVRVNALGFMVVQMSLAHPFNRPGNKWVWQWSFTPGF